jgi:sphingolipid delta-4 desaturase
MEHPLLDYRRTDGGEPHRIRHREILAAHPEIQALFGWDPWPKYRMTIVIALQLSLAYAIELAFAALGMPFAIGLLLATAYLFGAVLNHYGGVVIHEASHDLCARTSRQNRLIAIFANLPKVLPYAMTFRRHHKTHHIGMGIVGVDNDLPKDLERRAVANGPIRKFLWLVFYPFVGALLRSFFRVPNRWEVANVVIQLTFNAFVFVAMGPWSLLYLAISTFFSASLHPIAGHFIHEHYLWDERQETYSYYGPLNRVTLNMGYHVEHHDFPRVPGKNLPRLHQIAREYYENLTSHRSWSMIFWTFVTDRRLSHHSRFVRDASHMRSAHVATIPWPKGPRR